MTAQLINATDGYHLWSQRYDSELNDVFEVPDQIATAIAAALQLKLAPPPAAAERYKPSLPAYEAYLKGRHHSYKITPDSMAWAKECLQQAIALDPMFAQPYSELARLYISLAVGGIGAAAEVMPPAESLGEKGTGNRFILGRSA